MTSLVSQRQRTEMMNRRVRREKDRFEIFKMDDVNKLLELSRNRKLNLYLNDYVSVFLRIT